MLKIAPDMKIGYLLAALSPKPNITLAFALII